MKKLIERISWVNFIFEGKFMNYKSSQLILHRRFTARDV